MCLPLQSPPPTHTLLLPVLVQAWRRSSFAQRRLLLRILLKYILSHQQDICRHDGHISSGGSS